MFKSLCKVVTLITIALLWLSPLQAATYTVTSSQCSGPDSIVAAIDQANLNPGTDTIEFASGLRVNNINTGSCGLPGDAFSQDLFLGIVTGDLIINGNAAQLIGAPRWVDASGAINIVGACPSNPDLGASIVSQAPGFLRVQPGVSVTVNDLTALDLSAYIRMESGSTVVLNNVEARRINDWYMDCARQAIEAPFGNATLTITDSYFEQIQNTQRVLGSPNATVVRGSNAVSGAGSLTVTGTRFEDTLSAIQWSGDANIETSRFVDTGWINAFGPGTTNIVNSVFQGKSANSSDLNSVRASGGAIVNIKASSLSLLDSECPAACASGFGALVATTGGAINLAESALGVGLPALPPGGSFGVILRTAGGTITADVSSWIQPTLIQPADDLKAITGQPLLLTDVPGLPTIADGALFFFPFPNALTPLLGTAGNPGVLIDVIADAGAGGANELISPIDGSTITVDALGNPRVDGNGRRNIGGVQLQLAPYLNVVNTGDGTVDLSWSRPQDPDSGPITGYAVFYRPAGSADPLTRLDVAGASTVSTQVPNLVNGTNYEFQVSAVNASGDGPLSNQVTAIPLGSIGAPVVTAQPELNQMALTWTKPDAGGHTLSSYNIYYRLVGEGNWTYSQTELGGDNLMTTITGLMGGVAYEFGVQAVATDGTAGPLGTTVASPLASEATFRVTKSFSDLSTDIVRVTLSCNSGLPLVQSSNIAGGDPSGVNFVVTGLFGIVECEVTESGGPAGYTPVFNGGAGCSWSGAVASRNTCNISNVAQDATFTVDVEWFIANRGGIEVETDLPVTVSCDRDITSTSAGTISNDKRSATAVVDDGGSLSVTVDTLGGSANCQASQNAQVNSGVETDSDCGPRPVPAGSSDSCLITNTVYFEGVPTLNQYGIAILVLLMLGVGMVGFRRFS